MRFKNKETQEEYPLIKERLKLVLDDINEFHIDHGRQMIVTDLISTEGEDKGLKRVSPSHRQGRAADLRTRHLDPIFIKEMVAHFNKKYESWAAISLRTNEPTLMVYHSGTGLHLHIQVRPYEGK